MANTIITTKEIARSAMTAFAEGSTFCNLVTCYKGDNDTHNKGDTVTIVVPSEFEAFEYDPDSGIQVQAVEEKSIDVTLDKISYVSVELAAGETLENIEEQFIKPAARALAKKIDEECFSVANEIYTFVGTAGVPPTTIGEVAKAKAALTANGAPASPRYAFWSPDSAASLESIEAFALGEMISGDGNDGSMGTVFGMKHYTSPSVEEYTSALTACENVTVGGTTYPGAQTIDLTGTALTGRLVVGTRLKIGDQHFVVTARSSAASGNSISGVAISPAVSETISSGTEVTVVGDHTANLAFHPMAFAFVSRPLPPAPGVDSYITTYNGISMRVTRSYDSIYMREIICLDVLYGISVVNPAYAVCVLG